MDLYRGHEFWLQKYLFRLVIDEPYFIDLQIRIRESEPQRFGFVDSIRDLNSKDSTCFHEIQRILRNP
jgi:hypothetical protein